MRFSLTGSRGVEDETQLVLCTHRLGSDIRGGDERHRDLPGFFGPPIN